MHRIPQFAFVSTGAGSVSFLGLIFSKHCKKKNFVKVIDVGSPNLVMSIRPLGKISTKKVQYKDVSFIVTKTLYNLLTNCPSHVVKTTIKHHEILTKALQAIKPKPLEEFVLVEKNKKTKESIKMKEFYGRQTHSYAGMR
jgi:hypothetical protein